MCGEGYLVVVLDAQGRLPPDARARIRHLTAAGALPDGRPLRRLHLTLPSRRAALRARDEARGLGVNGAYRAGDQGALCDPFPPGRWA